MSTLLPRASRIFITFLSSLLGKIRVGRFTARAVGFESKMSCTLRNVYSKQEHCLILNGCKRRFPHVLLTIAVTIVIQDSDGQRNISEFQNLHSQLFKSFTANHFDFFHAVKKSLQYYIDRYIYKDTSKKLVRM